MSEQMIMTEDGNQMILSHAPSTYEYNPALEAQEEAPGILPFFGHCPDEIHTSKPPDILPGPGEVESQEDSLFSLPGNQEKW